MLSSGARGRRLLIEDLSRSKSTGPDNSITLHVCPATVSFSSARMLRSSGDSGRASRSPVT